MSSPPPPLCLHPPHLQSLLPGGGASVDSGMLNDPGFSDSSGAGAPVGGLEAALRPGSLVLKYTEMPSRAGLKSV